MVSNANEDFPDPLRPVITVSELRGISTLMFLRLCWRAPRTEILEIDMGTEVMNFGNVDDPTEIVDIRSAQLYSVS